jgi:hypothetical protein
LPDYEALRRCRPVNGILPARRLFGDGRFFTPSGRARLVAVEAAPATTERRSIPS